MLKTLRKKLTLLAACLTGSVVLAVCLISFLMIRGQYLQSRELAFRLAAGSVQSQWQMDDFLSVDWLKGSMEANGTTVVVWENHVLIYPGFSDKAQAEHLKQTVSHPFENAELYFTQDNFRCAWFNFDFSNGSRQILVWQDTSAEQDYLLRLGMVFAGIALVSLFIVGMLCYWVAGRAIAPAQEAMARQEQFVAAASHELRSPLTVLRTGFGVIEKDPAQTDHYLSLMRKEADRMSTLVNDLLILAGGGRLRRSFSPSPIELDTLLIDFADTMTPVADKAGIFLEIGLPEESLPPVPADENMIRQVLTILTDNALRYAPPGSAIQLSVRLSGKHFLLSVADHGCGIPDSEKDRVFDRFYRGSVSRTDPSHFGLGLSVAQELVAIHNGAIKVTDTPGGGATFQVSLPYGISPAVL